MKKRIISVGFLFLFILSMFSILVFAQEADEKPGPMEGAMELITDILGTRFRIPHGNWVRSKNQTVPLWAFVGVFVLLFSVIYVVVMRIPPFKDSDHPNSAKAFAVAFALIAIFSSGIVEAITSMIGGISGIATIVFFIVAILFLIGLGLAGGRLGLSSKHWGKEEVAETEKAATKLDKVRHQTNKERRELTREQKALNYLRKLNKRGFDVAESVRETLEDIIEKLKKVVGMNIPESQDVRKWFERIAEQLKVTLKELTIAEQMEQFDDLLTKAEAMTIAGFKEEKDVKVGTDKTKKLVTLIKKRVGEAKRKLPAADLNTQWGSLAAGSPLLGKVKALGKEILKEFKTKEKLLQEVKGLHANVKKMTTDFDAIMKKAIENLTHENAKESLGFLDEALKITENIEGQDRESDAFIKRIVDIDTAIYQQLGNELKDVEEAEKFVQNFHEKLKK